MLQSNSFAELLRTYRVGARLSQNALARSVGVNPAYVNRLESGERRPSQRHYVVQIAKALDLDEAATNSLLEAAGHPPLGFERFDPRDRTVQLVAGILADQSIPEDEREEFRQIITLIGHRWRGNGAQPVV